MSLDQTEAAADAMPPIDQHCGMHPFLRTMLLQGVRREPVNRVPLALARREALSRLCPATVRRAKLAAIEDVQLPGPASLVPARLYTPHGGGDGAAIVFFHGGCFVLGSIETHDALCRGLCEAAGALILSVGYRLAPEHKFPSGLEDCVAGVRWISNEGHVLKGSIQRLFVAGDSAGGNLANAVAMRLAGNLRVKISGQLLLYPMIDHVSSGHDSYETRDGLGLTRDVVVWGWSHYLPDISLAYRPEVSPLRASNLSGLPPTFLVTAEFDVLRDEGIAYARRLADSGVDVEHVHYREMNHGFAMWQGLLGDASDVIQRASAWIRKIRRC